LRDAEKEMVEDVGAMVFQGGKAAGGASPDHG